MPFQDNKKLSRVWTGRVNVEESDPQRLNDHVVEARKGLLHQRLPRVLRPRLDRLCRHYRVAYRLEPNQAELAVKVASCVSLMAKDGEGAVSFQLCVALRL